MRWTILATAAVLALAGMGIGGDSPVRVPAGEAPEIDGVLAEGEWKGALRVDLAPEGEAWLRRDEEALYVGLRVGRNCIPSLAFLRGGKVIVLHASASLGTAVYERSGEAWKATRSFSWKCRDGRTTKEDRDRFFADEGWVATTCGVGKRGEAEYRIGRRLLGNGPTRLALVACRIDPGPPVSCTWPASLADGTSNQRLLFGQCPDLRFSPESWAVLGAEEAETPVGRFDRRLEELEALAAKDPVGAYVALLDLLAEHGAEVGGRDRATELRRRLEGEKAVSREAAAQRRLESALDLARRKLREVETKYAGTRAARIAAERRALLRP